MNVQHVHLQCKCDCSDHVVRVSLESYPGEPPEISIQPILSTRGSFIQRFWVAFRYIFRLVKKRNRHWGGEHFADILLSEDGADKLSFIMSRYNLIVKIQELKRKSDLHKKDELGML